jgi:diaminohydroxyphosphoribosylaminopyrimidine deaminase / 5-amino-6-(5-phosphoribosylamino)uracil reductase
MKSMPKKTDYNYVNYALNLTRKTAGSTSSNPTVACIIVKNDIIVSTGVTAKSGRPHAEQIAINKITNKETLLGAEIYVTLEPCAHFGQTSPCVDEIIKCGFKRVIIATKDPDKRVDGLGIAKLQEAGIEVTCGILEKESQEVNRAFFKARQTGLPFVTLKLATSLDGKIATKNGDSKWITSEKSRLFSHHLRSINDAILVGANTVRKDNPSLDCRISGLEDFSPKRIILSNKLNLDPESKIFQNCSKIPTIILSKNNNSEFRIPSAQIIFCKEKNGLIDLQNALEKLCEAGINSVLVEGGQNVATQFLQENLVDELIWIRSGKIIGNDGIAAIGDLNFTKISDVFDRMIKTETRVLESDVIEIYRKRI